MKKNKQRKLEQRINKIKQYFKSGKVICPYAKKYIDSILFNGVQNNYNEKKIVDSMLTFAQDKDYSALVYIFETDLTNHDLERKRAITFFKDLFIGLMKQQYKTDCPSKKELEQTVFKSFLPESDINLHLQYANKGYYAIVMSKHYKIDLEDSHPRYTPQTICVITRHADVERIKKETPKIVELIREQMKKRTGSIYDANELYIIPQKYCQ